MNNIIIRTLTGAVFVSVVLLPLFWNDYAAAAFFSVFMILGLIEFYRLFKNNDRIKVSWELGLSTGVLLFGILACIIFSVLPAIFLVTIIPLLMLSFAVELTRKKENPLLNMAILLFGLIYVMLPFLLMVHFIHLDSSSFPFLVGMFLLIWTNDTFAYLTGRFLGKRKLIERISPNKTWEGLIGGIIFTLLSGFVIGQYFDIDHQKFWMIAALIIAPCAVVGDLLESSIKRNVGVKDSGSLMPGHGGVLDRFDAALFTVPFFLAWTYIYGIL